MWVFSDSNNLILSRWTRKFHWVGLSGVTSVCAVGASFPVLQWVGVIAAIRVGVTIAHILVFVLLFRVFFHSF